jgi:hypothetical protein
VQVRSVFDPTNFPVAAPVESRAQPGNQVGGRVRLAGRGFRERTVGAVGANRGRGQATPLRAVRRRTHSRTASDAGRSRLTPLRAHRSRRVRHRSPRSVRHRRAYLAPHLKQQAECSRFARGVSGIPLVDPSPQQLHDGRRGAERRGRVLTRKAIEPALAGDPVALRLCLSASRLALGPGARTSSPGTDRVEDVPRALLVSSRLPPRSRRPEDAATLATLVDRQRQRWRRATRPSAFRP